MVGPEDAPEPDGPEPDEPAELARKLQAVDDLRRRALDVIPHALRTPVTTFRGLAEALPTASESEIREQIAPALRRLAALAEHLLDDLLIAGGYSTTLPAGPPVPSPVAETARAAWAVVGRDRPLAIDVDPDVAVMAPAGSLAKMLRHLLDNTVKYGSGATAVRAHAHARDGTATDGSASDAAGRVFVDVVSAGPVPDDIAMLCEPLYRGRDALTRCAGVGVGLSVTAALAQQAGGSLRLLPGPGDDGLLARLALASAAAPAGLRVVVADDEPDVRLLLQLRLDSVPGITVVGEAGDGFEALERCRELRPDAVVMDLLMPRMLGVAAIEALRLELPEVAVVAYTATAGDFVRHELERLGVGLVLKSGDLGHLVDALRATVGRLPA